MAEKIMFKGGSGPGQIVEVSANDPLPVTLGGSTGGSVGDLETAGADSSSNTSNRQGVTSWLKGFNGTGWDRLRAGIQTATSTLTGFLNSLVMGVYNASPTALSEGQAAPFRMDTARNINVNLGTLLQNEGMAPTSIITQTTTAVRAAPAILDRIILTPVANAVIKIYNHPANATNEIFEHTFPAALLSTDPFVIEFNCLMSNGITVVTSGANPLAAIISRLS